LLDIIAMTDQQVDKGQTVLSPYLTPKRSGQQRIYTGEERKEHKKEHDRKHSHDHRAKCDLSTKSGELWRQNTFFIPPIKNFGTLLGKELVQLFACELKNMSFLKNP